MQKPGRSSLSIVAAGNATVSRLTAAPTPGRGGGALEVAAGGVRRGEDVQRARLRASREIRGALGKPDGLARVTKRRVGSRRQNPREAAHRRCQVLLEINRLAQLTDGFRE